MSATDRDPPGTSALLGDLETLRALLTEGERGAPAEAAAEPVPDTNADDEVPLLEDVVGGGVRLNDPMLSEAEVFGADSDEQTPGFNDELFRTLLGDEWRDSASELLDEARAVIEQHEQAWTSEHTDRLNAALKARIDDTLHRWLRETVLSQLDDLRMELLDAVKQQIRETTRAQFADLPNRARTDAQRDTPDDTPDHPSNDPNQEGRHAE